LIAKKRTSDPHLKKFLAYLIHVLRVQMNLAIYRALCSHAYRGHIPAEFLIELGNVHVGRQPYGDPRANGIFKLVGGLRTEMEWVRRVFF
jgi:hypothetical protein